MGGHRMPWLIPRELERGNAVFVHTKRFAKGSYCMWTLGHHGSNAKIYLGVDINSKLINITYSTFSIGEILLCL